LHSHLEPIAHVESCFAPALFLHGSADTFIVPQHSEALFNKYSGEKKFCLVDGDHNSVRTDDVREKIAVFLDNCLLVDDDGGMSCATQRMYPNRIIRIASSSQ
jgi:hypothetical protein